MSLLTQKFFCTDTVNTEISGAINSKMSPHTDTEKQRGSALHYRHKVINQSIWIEL